MPERAKNPVTKREKSVGIRNISELATIERVFNVVVDLPEAARADALAAECGADGQLRAAVIALLEAERAMPATSATPAAAAVGVALQTLDEKSWSLATGETIGAYRIEERLGKGGMGEVYRAHQSHPVERQVAIKLLRTPTLDASVVARFDTERQTLA